MDLHNDSGARVQGIEELKQFIYNAVAIKYMSIPFSRGLGIDLEGFLFGNQTQETKDGLFKTIRDSLESKLESASIEDIDIRFNPENRKTVISISVYNDTPELIEVKIEL
jgi:hypothetical protein